MDSLDKKMKLVDLHLIRMTRCRKFIDILAYVNKVKEIHETQKEYFGGK